MKINRFDIAPIILALFASASCANAQQPTAKTQNSRQQHEGKKAESTPAQIEIANLIADAKSGQAEFAADTLIRIIESGKIKDAQQKIELLEEAFRRASEAQHPVKISYFGVLSSRSGSLDYAFELGLAKLSLQCRAIKALLLVDQKRATALFNEISPTLSLPPLGCKDGFLFYNVSEFYDTLNEIIANSFSAKEKSRNEHIQFVLPYINNMTSPVQVVPIAKVILDLKPNQLQLPLLIKSFTQALKNIPDDDHSFRRWMSNDSTARAIADLAKACDEQNVPKQDLLQTFRTYLLTQLNGTRCSDGLKPNEQNPATSKYALPKYMEFVNSNLFADNPITANQIHPSKIEEATTTNEYTQNFGGEERLRKFRKLRFVSDGQERLTDTEKEKPEWQIELTQFLNDLAAWNPSKDESETDYFHGKCEYFMSLMEIIPKSDADTRNRVFSDYISFVSNSQMQRDNRIEWLVQADRLLDAVLDAKGKERAVMTETLNNAGNSTLQLYLKLKTLSPSPSQQAVKD